METAAGPVGCELAVIVNKAESMHAQRLRGAWRRACMASRRASGLSGYGRSEAAVLLTLTGAAAARHIAAPTGPLGGAGAAAGCWEKLKRAVSN